MSAALLLRLVRVGGPQWRRLLGAALLSAATYGSAVALMATSAWLISRAAQHPPVLELTVAAVGVRFFGISRGVARYGERLLSHDATFRVLADVRAKVFAALVPLAPAGTSAFRSGDLLTRLVADVDTLQDFYLRCLLPPLAAATVVAGAVGLAAWLLPAAGLALLVGALLAGVLVPLLASRVARRFASRTAAARGQAAVRGLDVVHGVADLVAYGGAGRAVEQAVRAQQDLAALERRSARARGAVAAAVTALQGATVVVVAVLALPAVQDGRLSGVNLAVVVLTAMAVFEALLPLPAAAQQLHLVAGSAQRVFDVLDSPSPVQEPMHPVPMSDDVLRIHLDRVSARYGADQPWALRDVDLVIDAGRRVAVVGASGSGKSTLLSLLLRFRDPECGRVLLDGVDITSLAGDDVRRSIQAVTHDAHLFTTTIRDNLRLARPDCTDEQLRAAAAQARILEWIEAQPLGWQTPVGEDGAQLSGGQRRRLVLARALLADPAVLLLDEPAEGLDDETAGELTADLLRVTAGRTTVLVTHRLDGLADVDAIVVLEAGRVVQRGTHAELVAVPGRYRQLWLAAHPSPATPR